MASQEILATSRPKSVEISTMRTPELAFTYHEVPLQDFISAISDAPYGQETIKTMAEGISTSCSFTQAHEGFVSALVNENLALLKKGFGDMMHFIRERCQEFVSSQHPSRTGNHWNVDPSPIVLQVQHHTTIFPNYSKRTIAYQDDIETGQDDWYSEESQSRTRPDKIVPQFPLPQWARYLHAMAKGAMAAQGNRRHVLGVLANHSAITFWYFDRGGGFYSAPIDITDHPDEIVSAFIHLTLSTAFALGLEPIIQSPDPWESLATMEKATITIQDIPFLLCGTLHISCDLEGRGLVLFSARKSVDCWSETIPKDVVLKLSWECPSSSTSDSLYHLAERHGVQGVAKLYHSSTLGRFSEGPRTQLNLKSRIHYGDRELRLQVLGPSCVPLYRVLRRQDFETIFRSLIQAHHMLYENAGILHCNLNTSSLMVSKDSPARGILLDLDFALQVQDGKPTFAGTLPFLSMDLLTAAGPPPPRLYRHDLESFFYILGWMLCRYDASGERKPVHQFAAWHRGPLDDIISAKRRLMRMPSHVPSEISSPSLQKWFRNLCRSFNDGYQEKDRESQSPLFDCETLGGYITFDKFIGAVP